MARVDVGSETVRWVRSRAGLLSAALRGRSSKLDTWESSVVLTI